MHTRAARNMRSVADPSLEVSASRRRRADLISAEYQPTRFEQTLARWNTDETWNRKDNGIKHAEENSKTEEQHAHRCAKCLGP